MKNKTLAAWLAFVGGPLGLHRFYLRGFGDLLGWTLPCLTLLGAYGCLRMWNLGQDDRLSWVLVPVLGLTIAGCALMAIIYGLMEVEKWNAKFNASAQLDNAAGATSWITIAAVVLSLMLGATSLMASLAISFQAFFQDQVAEGRKISQ